MADLHSPLRVFVVENHQITREALSEWLESMGHSVQSAGTVRETLDALPQAAADVLISDISLPDGNGWDMMRRLKLPRPLYAIAMSGLGARSDEATSKTAGFRHHLIKPFDPDRLALLLEEAAREKD